MRTFILEDVPAELALLKNLLSTYCPEVEVVGETGRLTDALELIPLLKPDLLLMDIEISGGTSYDLLDRLQQKGLLADFELIFMTGHKRYDYVTAAFAYSALDFLTKPIDSASLQKAVQRAGKFTLPNRRLEQLQLFMEYVRSADNSAPRMAVHLVGGILEFISVDDILYLEADGVMTDFVFANGTQLKAARNLGHYAQFLIFNHRFFSISNSLLINLKHMKRYQHSEKTVTMTNGKILYAARRGGQDLRHYLTRPYNDEAAGSSIVNFLRSFLGNKKK